MNKINLLLLPILLALEGCTPAYMNVEQDFLKYTQEPLLSGAKPTNISDGKAIKVAVAEFSLPNENGGPDYQMARLVNLTQYASEIVDDSIVKAGGSLVDKTEAARIKEYIQESEKHGGTVSNSPAATVVASSTVVDTGNCHSGHGHHHRHHNCHAAAQPAEPVVQAAPTETYAGLADVNYAMLGEISTVNYGSQTSTVQTNKGPLIFCNYSASVTGTLAVYKIPKTVRENSIRFQGDDSASTEGACQSGNVNPQIIKTALEKAINAVKAEFQNLLTVDAYVVEKRVDRESKKELFEISAGKNINLRPGMKMRVLHVEQHADPLTGNPVDQETMIGEGYVSDKIGPNRSWILVEPEDDKGIKRWDVSRSFYENCKYSFCRGK